MILEVPIILPIHRWYAQMVHIIVPRAVARSKACVDFMNNDFAFAFAGPFWAQRDIQDESAQQELRIPAAQTCYRRPPTNNFATMTIIDISNDAAAASLLDSSRGEKSILFFWAEWHAPSNSGGPFDTVVKTLAQQNDGSVKFYRVLAEECPKLSQKVCRLIG